MFSFRKPKNIKVRYIRSHCGEYVEPLQAIDKGDWIDLRSAATLELKAGERGLIPLGFAMELPKGYEAHIVPRSSTYGRWGIIQTNHCGIIDNSYCGDTDEWAMPVYALRDTKIEFNDRIAQFRIVKKQPKIHFQTVDHLGNADRGGFGSTGDK